MKHNRRQFIGNVTKAGLGVWAVPSLLSGIGSVKETVAQVVKQNGMFKIKINNQIFEPLSFRSFRPEKRNISEFYDTGVRLMSVLHTGLNCTLDVPYSPFGESWIGPKQYDFSVIDRQMELFIKNAPDAYFNIMLQLDTRDWYLKAHPEFTNSYWNLVEMAGQEQWREDTTQFLQDTIRYFEQKYGDKIFAYSLFCGASTEWYTNSQGKGRPEAILREHPIKEAAFRKFTGDNAAKLIPLKELHHTSHGVFRDPVADAPALRYWHFHHEIIGETILYFAKKTQEVLKHKKLLGLYYGYLTQLNGTRLLEEGHLAYERVWRCPDLDMIFAPAKYGKPRSFEGTSGFLATIDSLELNNKLVFQEIDHTTYIAPKTVENGRSIPGSDSKLKDEFQTRMVLRREFVLTRVKRTSLWWFDFFGGYFYAEPLMKEIKNMVQVHEKIKDLPLASNAEIAVFGDVESMYYAQAFSPLATDLLVTVPDELARIGAPYDIFNFSDLDHPKLAINQYKLFIFLNTFKITPEKIAFIQNKLKAKGRTLLWIYAPNYIQENGFSTAGISVITDFKVKIRARDEQDVHVKKQGFFAQLPTNTQYSFSKAKITKSSNYTTVDDASTSKISPLFEIEDPTAEVLGTFSDGKTAFARRKGKRYTSLYSTIGNMPAPIFREIARNAGVHIYYEGTDPVYINNRLIGIHMQSDTAHTIKLPNKKTKKLTELFDGGEVSVVQGKCTLPHALGSTKLYLLPFENFNK
jgi:beta-galactosidase